jgi:hypothetical protein
VEGVDELDPRGCQKRSEQALAGKDEEGRGERQRREEGGGGRREEGGGRREEGRGGTREDRRLTKFSVGIFGKDPSGRQVRQSRRLSS